MLSLKKANGIQGGYITGDTAGVIGEDITFTAVAYKGNTFDGWYDADGKLLSTDATVTVTVSEGLTYVAKFDIENLWPDAGYENFPLGTSLLYTDGGDTKKSPLVLRADQHLLARYYNKRKSNGRHSGFKTHTQKQRCFNSR